MSFQKSVKLFFHVVSMCVVVSKHMNEAELTLERDSLLTSTHARAKAKLLALALLACLLTCCLQVLLVVLRPPTLVNMYK